MAQAELELAKQAMRGMQLTVRGAPGLAARLRAIGDLPLPPAAAWELFSHPDNSKIFRGIERCTYRKVLWAGRGGTGGAQRQTVEVENESGQRVGGGAWGAGLLAVPRFCV